MTFTEAMFSTVNQVSSVDWNKNGAERKMMMIEDQVNTDSREEEDERRDAILVTNSSEMYDFDMLSSKSVFLEPFLALYSLLSILIKKKKKKKRNKKMMKKKSLKIIAIEERK